MRDDDSLEIQANATCNQNRFQLIPDRDAFAHFQTRGDPLGGLDGKGG